MKKVQPHGIGMILGATIAIWHVLWATLVLIGLAQSLLDFVFDIHMIANPYIVQAFDVGKAVLLVGVTFIIGYVLGWIFGSVWNMMGKR